MDTGVKSRFFRGRRVITRRPKVRKPRKFAMGGRGLVDPLTRKIKKVLDQQSETKYVAQQIITDTAVPYVGGAATTFLPLQPVVAQNAAGISGQSNQRVGERIKPVKISADFQFCFNPTSTQSHDYRVKLFVLKPKSYNNYNAMVASAFTG